MNKDLLRSAFTTFCRDARVHERAGRIDAAWAALEAAHIIGQQVTWLHATTHWEMLLLGLRTRDRQEAVGQVVRLLAAVLITRFWVPAGNSGRAHVSATASQIVPSDLRKLMRDIGVGPEVRE